MLALGTTDAANIAVGSRVSAAQRIDRMMAVIGDDPVLWVDVKTLWRTARGRTRTCRRGTSSSSPRRRATPTCSSTTGPSVVPDDWFQRDRIHYTSTGYTERARLIADALAAAYPG